VAGWWSTVTGTVTLNELAKVTALGGGSMRKSLVLIFSGVFLVWSGPSYSVETHPLLKALAGSWKGSGTVKAGADKPKERLRCRLDQTLTAAGNEISQSMKCAGTSFRLFGSGTLKFDAKSNSFKGTFSASGNSGHSIMRGRNQGAKSVRLTVTNTGYKQIRNKPGTLSIRMLGPSKHIVTLTQRQAKSGRNVEVYRVVYAK